MMIKTDRGAFMKIEAMFDSNEKPLDTLVSDGGFCGIFRTIGCIGDSLSSGEFEAFNDKNERCWHDCYEYSWGQYMARTLGNTVYNFSKGGMTAKCYMESFAEEKDFFNPEKQCQAYIIAMGCNDITAALENGTDLGNMADIKEDYRHNADSFVGYYAAIIARYKEISPKAKFFLVTMPITPGDDPKRAALREAHAGLVNEIASHFENCYVIDLRKYAPVYGDAFHDAFYLNGHLSAAGYLFTARIMMSYIDYIIRHNMADFRKVGLAEIGLH